MFKIVRRLGDYEYFRLFGVVTCLAGLTVLAGPSSLSKADDPPILGYIRIEEDWVLELSTVDSTRAVPQVATEMAPAPNSAFFCTFELNHRRLPTSANGGLQVQIWKNGAIQNHKSEGTTVMNTPAETITWTQAMERNGSALKFSILQGASVTWGNLASANLQVSAGDSKQYFDKYSSADSASRSVITYGAHRVKSLRLVQVRKYRIDGQLGVLVYDVETGIQTVWDSANQG